MLLALAICSVCKKLLDLTVFGCKNISHVRKINDNFLWRMGTSELERHFV